MENRERHWEWRKKGNMTVRASQGRGGEERVGVRQKAATKLKANSHYSQCVIDWVAFRCQGSYICKLLICSCCQGCCSPEPFNSVAWPPGHTSHNQIKQPPSHMQDNEQLPRAAPALTYCIFFFFFSICVCCNRPLSVCKRSGFKGLRYVSDELLCLCSADVPLTFWLVVVVFCFYCFVAHKPHFPFERLDLYTAALYAWCSIFTIIQLSLGCTIQQQGCFILHTLHLPVWLCATETNTRAKPFRFLFLSSVSPHFQQWPAVQWACSHSVWTLPVSGCRPLKQRMNSSTSDIFFNYWFIMRPAGIIGLCILYIPFQHFPVWFGNHVKWNGVIWRGDSLFH